MKLRKNQILDVEIESLAFTGKGVAKVATESGKFTVFVNKVVPGDVLKVELMRVRNRWAEAKVLELIKPSPNRIAARCEHFNICGGCSLQNLTYEEQLNIKKHFVVDAFKRLGGFENPPVMDVIKSPDEWYYRNKTELSFGQTEAGETALGFHIPGRKYDIFDLKECFLQSEFVGRLAKKVMSFMRERNVAAINSRGEGVLRTLALREAKNLGGKLLILTTSPGEFEWMTDFSDMLKAEFGSDLSGFVWMEKIAQRGRPTEIIEHHMWGEKSLRENLKIEENELSFEIEPQAFFQPNSLGAQTLYAQALRALDAGKEDLVFDLFCGTGTIGICVAPDVGRVIGIELNEGAINSARLNAAQNNIQNIEFICGDVAKVLLEMEEKPDKIILDPPRAGLTQKALELVINFNASRIVYVSCNPSTLARDCALLKEQGYELKNVQPVDMFPQTYHVESVATLELTAGPASAE